MSKYYLSHATFLLLKATPPQCTMRGLLELLSQSSESKDVRFRQGEKTVSPVSISIVLDLTSIDVQPYGKVNKVCITHPQSWGCR